MRAVHVGAFGGPDTLEACELPVPAPGAGEVLVRVAAAGVNFADLRMRSGAYPAPPPIPFVPGFELSGHVESVGPGAAALALDPRVLEPGTRVVAVHAVAAYAEYAVVPADMLVPLSEGLDLVDAAAMPVAYGVAWMALHTQGGLRPHETVLVHAAGSGVGLAAVQLAAAAGARTVGLASTPRKVAIARDAGASLALGYGELYPGQEIRDAVGSVDLLLDSLGGESLLAGLGLLGFGGRAVCFGQASGSPAALDLYRDLIPRQLEVLGLARGALVDAPDPAMRRIVSTAVARVLDLWGSGRLPGPLVTRLPLAEAARAHVALADRGHSGKIVLVP